MPNRTSKSKPSSNTLSLLAIIKTEQEQKGTVPVFGVQASWLCFGSGLAARLLKDWESGKHSLDVLQISDVAYLYRLYSANAPGTPAALICPALGIDTTGDFLTLLSLLNERAQADAELRTGKKYSRGNPRLQGVSDVVQTTAWQGETRPLLTTGEKS